jgi:hypothetical protein
VDIPATLQQTLELETETPGGLEMPGKDIAHLFKTKESRPGPWLIGYGSGRSCRSRCSFFRFLSWRIRRLNCGARNRS